LLNPDVVKILNLTIIIIIIIILICDDSQAIWEFFFGNNSGKDKKHDKGPEMCQKLKVFDHTVKC